MSIANRLRYPISSGLVSLAAVVLMAAPATGQSSPEPVEWTTDEDHQHMLDLLGIERLRPGPSGNEDAPNAANYDEATANPYPNLPPVLALESGTPITSPEDWWSLRRPEIVELFEREVLGRVPDNAPGIDWDVVETAEGRLASRPVAARRLIGQADNRVAPGIEVGIEMTLVVPSDAEGPVPVMIMFRGGGLPEALGTAEGGGGGDAASQDPPPAEQLIAAGWGFAFLNPRSIQADNGAGLTRGIIGLANQGQPRKPDDWGSLRAWAWGASRALDYLETLDGVDASAVGIEGVSRYGKAALVTMAFDTRFAVVLVGSSGEGGASLYRRNWGEAVENLTGRSEYHWMAGNFLKYGTEVSTFGRMDSGDLPVDSHQLMALVAPRPMFISYGIPERGDAHWLDHQGSYMAAVAAGPVYRLLGATDLGTSDDYMSERMPAVNVDMLDGELAWRQHDGGHTDGPNWRYFIPWADRMLGRAN